MKVTVIGTGYVGLVAAACFADTGHTVIGVDRDREKLARLRRGEVPIYEPGLGDVLIRAKDRLSFTDDVSAALQQTQVVFVAVGTPERADGSADLEPTWEVIRTVAKHAFSHPVVLVLKSTVPVGTAEKVMTFLKETGRSQIDVVSNPEFLKEGTAVDDFLRPDRVVIGTSSERAAAVMRELYDPFLKNGNPILVMDNAAAELTKYAANSFLALKISFINELALLCDAVGADINDVRRGFTSDRRINPAFFHPGVGFGGSCFPKDVSALTHKGREESIELHTVEAAGKTNARQKRVLFDRLTQIFATKGGLRGKRIAIWGLSFKPQTDDVREAPAETLITLLHEAGAVVAAFDPIAGRAAQAAFAAPFELSPSALDAASGAHALAIVTEWNEFRGVDFTELRKRMVSAIIVDGRNVLDPTRALAAGFEYDCIGRRAVYRRAAAAIAASGRSL